MKQFLLINYFLFLIVFSLAAQRIYENPDNQPWSLQAQKAYQITLLQTPPVIDGVVDDSIWQNLPVADGFTTTLPRFGLSPQFPTTVKMGYTTEYIFIAATCRSDKVRDDGSERDETGAGDYFSVGFDTWNDDQNAFVFAVTAAGQLIESNNGDNQYQAPWEAATSVTSIGWTVEIKIPFAALRYPEGSQPWGLQFSRFDRSSGETTTWNPQSPVINDVVWQYGEMAGLDLSGKMRYQMVSLLTDQVLNYSNNTSNKYPTAFLGMGLDYHRALGSASTLDISVIPALGFSYTWKKEQEIRLKSYSSHESTPLEATESNLFTKYNLKDPFPNSYPQWYTTQLVAISDQGRITDFKYGQNISEFKLTHRTRNNWKLGTATTLCLPSYAVILDNISGEKSNVRISGWPVYNYTAAEKIFRNNSFFHVALASSIIGENKNHNTLVTGGKWRDRNNTYEISGNWYLNLQNASVKRLKNIPDGKFAVRKANGVWRWGALYDVNGNQIRGDFGPQQYVNPLKHNNRLDGYLSHYNYTPKWQQVNLIWHQIGITSGVNELDGTLKYHHYYYGLGLQDSNFRNYSLGISTSNRNDRNGIKFDNGPEFITVNPPPVFVNLLLSNDARKKWRISAEPGFTIRPNANRYDTYLNFYSQWRLNPFWSISNSARVNFIHHTSTFFKNTTEQYFIRYFDQSRLSGNFQINYIPNCRMAFGLSVNLSPDNFITGEETFQIDPDLQLTPVNITIPGLRRNDQYAIRGNAFLYGRAGTKYGVNFAIYRSSTTFVTGPFFSSGKVVRAEVNFSFIHNLVKLK